MKTVLISSPLIAAAAATQFAAGQSRLATFKSAARFGDCESCQP